LIVFIVVKAIERAGRIFEDLTTTIEAFEHLLRLQELAKLEGFCPVVEFKVVQNPVDEVTA
jgi:hypothetical protein